MIRTELGFRTRVAVAHCGEWVNELRERKRRMDGRRRSAQPRNPISNAADGCRCLTRDFELEGRASRAVFFLVVYGTFQVKKQLRSHDMLKWRQAVCCVVSILLSATCCFILTPVSAVRDEKGRMMESIDRGRQKLSSLDISSKIVYHSFRHKWHLRRILNQRQLHHLESDWPVLSLAPAMLRGRFKNFSLSIRADQTPSSYSRGQ